MPIKDIVIFSNDSKLGVVYSTSSFDEFPSFARKVYRSFDLYDAKTGEFSETRNLSTDDDVLECAMGNENTWLILIKKAGEFNFNKIDPTKAPEIITTIANERFGLLKKPIQKDSFPPKFFYIGNNSFLVKADDFYIVNDSVPISESGLKRGPGPFYRPLRWWK